MMQRIRISATALTCLLLPALFAGSQAQAGLTTDSLQFNFDDDQRTEATWTSSSPAGNMTQTYDMSGGAGGANPTGPTLVPVSSRSTISQAYQFDGGDDVGDSGPRGNDYGAFNSSVEIWFKPTDLSGSELIFESGGASRGFAVYLDGSNLKLTHANNNFTLSTQLTTSDINDFTQVVYTNEAFNFSGGTLYVNPIGSVSPGTADDASNKKPTKVAGPNRSGIGGTADGNTGGGNNLGVSHFDGQIALNRYYSKVLTSEEVANNYNAVIPEPSTLGLMGLGGLTLLRRRRRGNAVGMG